MRLGTTLLGRGGRTYAIAGVTVLRHTTQRRTKMTSPCSCWPDRDTGKVVPKTIKMANKPLLANTPVTTFGWGFTKQAADTGSLRLSTATKSNAAPTIFRWANSRLSPSAVPAGLRTGVEARDGLRLRTKERACIHLSR